MDKKSSKISQNDKKLINGLSVIGDSIYTPQFSTKKHIYIQDGIIQHVGKIDKSLIRKSRMVFDTKNLHICPGFIDMHTYGAYGTDTHACTEKELITLSYNFPKHGITAFLPSVGAGSSEIIENAFRSSFNARKQITGAEILGLYSEGLCTHPDYRGAQRDIGNLCSLDEFINIVIKYPNTLKVLMLAPELEEARKIKKTVSHVEKNVVFSIGHSNATSKLAFNSFRNGYKLVTHLFNAMSGFRHREIGLAGATLLCDDVWTEIIPDGVHVSFEAVKLVLKVKKKSKIISITDSNAYAGQKIDNQRIIFLGQPATVTNHGVYLDDGRLAASILILDQAVRNLTQKCGLPFETALFTVTSNPAECLGIAYRKGFIQEGYDADLTVLDVNKNKTMLTIARGKVVWNKLSKHRVSRGDSI